MRKRYKKRTKNEVKCFQISSFYDLYIKYLNETWWNSLTEEQKQHYHELEERKKIRDREKLNLYLSFIKSACLATHAEEAMDRISDVEKIIRRL